MPEGTQASADTNMLHFWHSKDLPKFITSIAAIVTGNRCDCGSLFCCHCDILTCSGGDCILPNVL